MSDCQHQTRGLKESGVQNQRQPSAEERERLLDAITDCLENIEKDSDIEELERRLEQLDPENELSSGFDLNRSLDEFYQKYDMDSSAGTMEQSVSTTTKKNRRFFRHTARIAIIAAILCSFIVVAQASGFDILRAIAEWTSAQFHLEWVTTPEVDTTETSVRQHESLQDVLALYDVQVQLVPTVFPEGCQLENISTDEINDRLIITASYIIPDGNMFISIRNKAQTMPFSEVEKNDETVQSYWKDNIEHHIIVDVTQLKALWQNGEWECYIAGNISYEEIVAMIDSIYL